MNVLSNPNYMMYKNEIKRLCKVYFFILFLLIAFKQVNANDSLGIRLRDIALFESDNIVDEAHLQYNNCFIQASRFIYIKLTVDNLKKTLSDQSFNVSFIWRYQNDEEFSKAETTFNVKKEWETSYIYKGVGWPDKGYWPLGLFKAQVYVNGELFAEKDFFINDENAGFKLFPETNSDIEILKKLPSDIHYQILHQYKVDSIFNSYYKIQFDHNGQNIVYKLSQYSLVSNLVTRNVYLFKGNKQIIPVYFIIDNYFDNDLKNLGYWGLIPKENNNQVFGFYNGIQRFSSPVVGNAAYNLFDLHVDFFISPDKKKYTYIWDSKTAAYKGLKLDPACEFPIINDNKIQPEWLADAKDIHIARPVVYVKNQDNSYNLVYSMRYKNDKGKGHVMLNELEKISPVMDGYIGRPFLSPNEKNIAYIYQNGKDWFVMVNNKKVTKGYEKIEDNVKFDQSGDTVYYVAKIDGDWYMMKNDIKISQGVSDIKSFITSPIGNNVAYVVKKLKKWGIYVNDKLVSGGYDYINKEVVFSEDGKKIAYAAAIDKSMFVMIDNQRVSGEYPEYHLWNTTNISFATTDLGISGLLFNKSGDKIAYLYEDSDSDGDMINVNRKSHVMVNTIEVSPEIYSANLISLKSGQFIYADIDCKTRILNHIEIDF